MRLLFALCVLALVACHPQPPQHAAPPPRNTAIDYAHTIVPDATCAPLSTAQPKQPDTALCDVGQILVYCRVGVGAGSNCLAFADLRPPKQEAPNRAGKALADDGTKPAEPPANSAPPGDGKPPAKKPKPEPKK